MPMLANEWAWQDIAPKGFAIGADYNAWQDISPVGFKPFPEISISRNILVVRLEVDGLKNIEIPASSIQLRLRHVSASYIRVNIPDPVRYTDEILARSDGVMRIFTGYETPASRWLEELIYANIQNVYFTRSDTRNQLTLTGTRFRTYSSPKSVSLNNIFSLRVDDEGKYNVRCALDHFVRPQDTVALSGGESFTVKFISVTIQHDNAWMDVEGE